MGDTERDERGKGGASAGRRSPRVCGRGVGAGADEPREPDASSPDPEDGGDAGARFRCSDARPRWRRGAAAILPFFSVPQGCVKSAGIRSDLESWLECALTSNPFD